MSIEGFRIRIEPGTHGHSFVVREASSDRCLRRALACVAGTCMGHADSLRGRPQMLLAMFRDVRHVDAVVAGKEPIELSGFVVPEAILEGICYDNTGARLMGVSLQDSGVALVGCFHTDREKFLAS